jgi:hypothetical protein
LVSSFFSWSTCVSSASRNVSMSWPCNASVIYSQQVFYLLAFIRRNDLFILYTCSFCLTTLLAIPGHHSQSTQLITLHYITLHKCVATCFDQSYGHFRPFEQHKISNRIANFIYGSDTDLRLIATQ